MLWCTHIHTENYSDADELTHSKNFLLALKLLLRESLSTLLQFYISLAEHPFPALTVT